MALTSLLVLLLFAVPALVLASPFTPTEAELDRRLKRVREDPTGREYQAKGAEKMMSKAEQGASWVKRKLAKLYVTPARLALALGIVGIFFTMGKNKRKVRWSVLTVFSWLLTTFGGAAMLFDWRWASW